MIDKKKVTKAAAAYAKGAWNHNEEQFACMYGFGGGANWTQKEFKKSLWHDAKEEPNPKLYAWIILQSGEDSWEIVKYDGYNKDGGQTWQREAAKGHALRWCYLSDILPQEKKGGSNV